MCTHVCTCVCKLSKGSVLNFGSTFHNFLVICWVHCICNIGTVLNLRGRIRIKMYTRHPTHRMGSVFQIHWALKSVALTWSVVSSWWHGWTSETSSLQEWVTRESLGKVSVKANGNCISYLSWGICTLANYGNLDLQILRLVNHTLRVGLILFILYYIGPYIFGFCSHM